MCQAAKNNYAFASEWGIFEGQQPFPEWQSVQPHTLLPENLEWTSTYLTQEESPRSSIGRSTQHENSPVSRDVTPESPSSTASKTKEATSPSWAASAKEAAYRRRLYQNREAQRAHRARQKQHRESLEAQLQTVISKYRDLQQKYSSLIALYECLAKEKERKETGMNYVQQTRFDPNGKSESDHVTDESWSQGAFEVDYFVPNTWQQWNHGGVTL